MNLGDEFDKKLWSALESTLRDLGAKISDSTWGVAGAQEIAIYDVYVKGSCIRIESETYFGVTVSGCGPLVDKVHRLVEERMALG